MAEPSTAGSRKRALARLGCAAAIFAAVAPAVLAADDAATQKLFFANLAKLCGQKLDGATEFPQDADHPLVGKQLTIDFASCSESEIRISLRVGENTSRTWIVTLGADGLWLKHDHRHPDGTPDRVTMYGGSAVAGGAPHRQRFAADGETAQMLPEAASNVWTLEIDLAKEQLIYALARHGQPRYKGAFALTPARK